MPNYRKNKQLNKNNRNKNKNKNLNQNKNKNDTNSSSVKQELSELDSVGIRPNLPADVNYLCIDTTTSASALDIEKGVDVDDDYTSPSSNEEINRNACNVDIDTCSSDTVLTQSYFCSSSSKKSTEIEHKSESTSTVFDADSTFGNFVIRETFEAGTGINSSKTGSAHTKDAAVPTAARSATRSVETTRISDLNRTDSERIRDETELASGNEDRAATVHGILKDSSSRSGSEEVAIVHKTIKTESTSSSLPRSTEKSDHFETVIVSQHPQVTTSKVIVHQISNDNFPQDTPDGGKKVTFAPEIQQTPEGTSSKVIVHQISKEDSPSYTPDVTKVIVHQISNQDYTKHTVDKSKNILVPVASKVIVHEEEESETTSHVAGRKEAYQSQKVIAKKISKKTAVRSTTSSLQTLKKIEDQIEHDSTQGSSTTKAPEQVLKVIVHQISKEDSPQPDDSKKVSFDPVPQEVSKVIVHQISKEDSPQPDDSKKVSFDPVPQEVSKVIVHQISKEDSPQPDDSSNFVPQEISNVILHQISKDETNKVDQRSRENSPQWDDSKKLKFDAIPQEISKGIVYQISKEDKLQPNDSKKVSFDPVPQEISNVIVHEILEDTSKETDHQSIVDSKKVSFDPVPQEISNVIVHEILEDTSKETDQQSIVDFKKVSFDPVPQEISNVIVHEILEDTSKETDQQSIVDSKKVSFDPVPQEISNVIVHEILEDTSKETDQQSIVESDDRKKVTFDPVPQVISNVIVHEVSVGETEKIDQVIVQTSRESSPQSDDSKKVIFNPIPQEISKEEPKTKGHIDVDAADKEVHQPVFSFVADDHFPKVVFPETSQESKESEELSKVIVHQISVEDSLRPLYSPQVSSRKDGGESKHVRFDPIPQGTSKVTIHQISREDSIQEGLTVLPTATEKAKVIIHEAPKEVLTELSVLEDHHLKTIVQQISSEESTPPTPFSPPVSVEIVDKPTKAIVRPPLQRYTVPTSSTKGILNNNLVQPPASKISTEEAEQSPRVITVPIFLENSTQSTTTSKLSPPPPCIDQTPKEIFVPILVENSAQTLLTLEPTPPEVIRPSSTVQDGNLRSEVIFEQISRGRSPETQSEEAGHLSEKDTEDHSNTKPTPHPRTAFPVCRSPKVIVHQIYREGSLKPVFPFTPKSLEKLDHSSKKIANQILQDVSTELQSSFRAKTESRATQKIVTEPARTSFPLSTKTTGKIRPGFFETSLLQTETNPVDDKSKVIVHPISREESAAKNLTDHQSFHSKLQNISQRSSDQKPDETIPLNSTSGIDTHRSEEIVEQVLREQSKSTQSSFLTTSSHKKDRRIQSNSGTKSAFDDLEPKVITHQISQEESKSSQPTSPDTFPLSTHHKGQRKTTHHSNQTSLPKDHESKVIVHQISREEAKSSHSRKTDQRLQSHSGTRSALDDLEPKVRTVPSFPVSTEKKDQSTQFDSNQETNCEPNVIQPGFPVTSGLAFPLSTEKEHHPVQYTPRQTNFESKGIDLKILREESELHQSSSTITSPFGTTVATNRKDQRIQSDSGSRSPPNDCRPKVITHQVSTEGPTHPSFPISSFPLSAKKNHHPPQYTSTAVDHESKEIDLQLLREESELHQSSSTVTSPFGPTVLTNRKDQRTQSDSGSRLPLDDIEPNVIAHRFSREDHTHASFPLSSGLSFPLSAEKNRHHPDQYTPMPEDLELKEIELQILREETELHQSSSTLTNKKDQRILSNSGSRSPTHDHKPKVITHQISTEGPTHPSFPVLSGHTFPISKEKKHHPHQYTPRPVNFESKEIDLQILREESELHQSSSTITSPFGTTVATNRKDQRIQSDSGSRSPPNDCRPKVITHQVSTEGPTHPSFPISSFPLSAKKNHHPPQYTSTAVDHESKEIDLQLLREESELHQSSSTVTSPFGPTVLTNRKDQRTQSDSGSRLPLDDIEPNVIAHRFSREDHTHASFPLSSGLSFPLSAEKNRHHPDQYTPMPEDLELKEIKLQILREESELHQSSSTLTNKKDQRILSNSGSRSPTHDHKPKVITHQISTEGPTHPSFPVLSGHTFPISKEKKHHPHQYTPRPVNFESKEIDLQILREESELHQSSSTITSPFGTTVATNRKDQRIQSDSGSRSPPNDCRPKVITHQVSTEGPTHPSFPISSFPLSAKKNHHPPQYTSTAVDHESKEIDLQHLREESELHQSSSTVTSPFRPTVLTNRKDQRTQSDSGSRLPLDDIEPNVIAHRFSREDHTHASFPLSSGLSFPLSAEKNRHHPDQYTPMPEDLELKEIELQILREETELHQSSSTLTNKKDQRILSNSGSRSPTHDHKPKVITHQISTEGPTHPSFPVLSGHTFPISKEKKHHPHQYTPRPVNFESKEIDLQILREESELHQSSSTITSPFGTTVATNRKDQRIQSDSGSRSPPNDCRPKVITHQVSTEGPTHPSFPISSFPLSAKKNHHPPQYTSTAVDHESKEIDLQLLREESELHQSSSTVTSPFGPTVLTNRKDQRTQSDSGSRLPLDDIEPNVIAHRFSREDHTHASFPLSSGLSFPLSAEKNRHHPDQYTPMPEDLELKEIKLQILREESELHQSSSTLTNKKDQRILSNSGSRSPTHDHKPKVITHQISTEGPTHPSFPVLSGHTFPISKEKKHHPHQYTPRPVNFESKEIDLQILREESELHQSSSTITSPFGTTVATNRKDQRIQSDSGSRSPPNDCRPKVITHQVSTEGPTHPSFPISSFPLSAKKNHHPPQYTSTAVDHESKEIDLQHLREESELHQSSSTVTSPFRPTVLTNRKDQRTQSDSGSTLPLDDIEPNVIAHRFSREDHTHASFPLSSGLSFPLSAEKNRHHPDQYTPMPEDLELKEIELQILREESELHQSSSTLTNKKDQRILSNSGSRSPTHDHKPKVITHQISTEGPTHPSFPVLSGHTFPISKEKKHHPHQYTPRPVNFESKEIDLQILREESELRQSSSTLTSPFGPTVSTNRKDQRIQSDSGSRSPTNNREPKVITHQISTEGPKHPSFPVVSENSFPLSVEKKHHAHQYTGVHAKARDLRIQSNSGSKSPPNDRKPKVITHQISTEGPTHPNFPVTSFPISVKKKHHPLQYTPTPLDRELKEIDLQAMREEPELQQSSATLTSPFAVTVTTDQRIQFESGSRSPSDDRQSKVIDGLETANSQFPASSGVSFPLSTQKEQHPAQYTASSKDLESKQIDMQILREESKLHQSSSTLTSPFGLPVTDKNDDKQIQADSGNTDLASKVVVDQMPVVPPSSPPSSYPPPMEKELHPVQYTSILQNLESKENVLQTVREESKLHQSSGTLTPPFALTVTPKTEDIGNQSTSDHKTKVITSKTSKEGSLSLPQTEKSDSKNELESGSPSDDLKSKVIVPQISKESLICKEGPNPLAIDHQTSQDESTSSSSSSEGSVLTAIQVKSPELSTEDQKEKVISKNKSKRSSYFLTSLELTDQIKADKSDSSDTDTLRGGSETPSETEEELALSSPKATVREKTLPATGRVIVHPIVREIVTDKPVAYRVESPQPDRPRIVVKKSKSFDDDDVIIQEMSDTSSAGDTDNPPVISEAESETDTLEVIDEFPDTQINSRVLSIQTLPIDHEDDITSPMSPKTAQDYKIRRQQNRAALESHFLPQFISPIFLDSIKEENSDLSDSDRRSECSDRADHATRQGDLEDDVFLEGGPLAKKADAVFPKSNLDFSKKHKHVHTSVRPPKTSVIREEAPPPSVVEAKIIDQGSVEESVSSWCTDLTPESEAAEVVYIDSASSSVSDLLELDYSEGLPDDSNDIRIQTPTIALDGVNEIFAYNQSKSNEPVKTPPQSTSPPPPTLPPVKEEQNMSEQILSTDRVEMTIMPAVEHKISDEIILEKIETVSETVCATNAAATDGVQNSTTSRPNSCDSAINEVAANDKLCVAVGCIDKMENIREIVSASQSELNTITDHDIVKPNFKIGEPCSDHTFKCDTTTTSSSTFSSPSSTTTSTTTTTTTTISTTSGTHIFTLHDLSQTQHLHPLGVSSSALDRQESLDSHGSDQSQSTNQSQCTAINQGSLPHTDWNEFDTTTDTTYVSGSDTAGLASSENSSPITTGGARSGDDTESPPIRKLRSLCTEALASMPYGEDVLEELATVANNIGDMPYPLPELPHIQDIQVSLRSEPSTITLTQVPPRPTPVGQKFKSPPPPPVPEPPTKYDSWLGVPTESDPSVLVCLSPSQRSAVKDDSTPDSLLDMHTKFVERRGYHEYTTKQVNAMNRETSTENVKLSRSNSPPPPLPPRPQQSPPSPPPQMSKSNGNEQATDINADDQNNHRLLAIIRDTHDSQQQQQQSSSENISRRTESGSNTTNPPTTTHTTTNSGGGQEEFANSPSVSKQTQKQFVSESNKSESVHTEMQTGQTERTIKVEPVTASRFPTSDYFDSLFNGTNKRFSNIEMESTPGFCSQILSTQPKRYSNIETSSFESRKCIENGKVLYDISDSNRQKFSEGEKPDSIGFTSFPQLQTKVNSLNSFPYISATPSQVDSPTQTGGSENIMSAFKLSTQTTAPPVPAQRVEVSPPAPPVPPLPPTIATTTTTTSESTSTSASSINRNFNGETKGNDIRQPAKKAAAGEQSTESIKKSTAFDHEKLFKDFDELSNLLKDELESGKRRPPATLDGNDIPDSVSDYKRVARESKIQSSHVSSSTVESSRREQMKKLADEIDRTAGQRQQHRKEIRIPIKIEKPTPTPPRSAPEIPQQQRTYEIPVQVEQPAERVHEIPVRVEKGTDTQSYEQRSLHHQRSYEIPTRSLHHQRSYEIPVQVEHQTGARNRTRSEHQVDHRSHEAPVRVERPQEQPERFRRAESMFNISDTTSHRHMLHDDWMKYVGDLGSSENICKPFQREVEICYLGRRPNIRAPRMSASTSDLSSTHSFDTYGANDVRRTTTTQTPRPQQTPRRRFLSTQSMIDTTPITPCVSSSRRSPAPERRSSLPKEIHDEQWKYISSKEQQLRVEFERLENDRRQLIDEMNRAQINQRMNREAYRQRQLPPLTEDESFRQQMAEEWLHKVAEREERRLQKIIKISKINQDASFPTAPPRRVSSSDIGDEFLRRVKERRSKLCMPSDSDWDSGAESQPAPRTDGNRSENEEPQMKVLEGQSEADIKQLPKHLREFAKLTSQVKEEHREETTENTSCSAIKKSSIVTTVKTSNATTNTNNQTQSESLQQDAARARDLEQLSQGKRQKLVTILRHKKPTESSSPGGCQPVAIPAGPVTSDGVANSAKRRKQTRFLLTPNRRSWSESDLLREIDKELVLAKGFLYANGVWTPKNQTPTPSGTNLNEFQPHKTASGTTTSDKIGENRSSRNQKNIPTPPPPPLWTPQPERKQFRPVHFESPKLQRRYVRQQSTPTEAPPPPWSYTNSQPFPGYQSQSCTNLSQKNTAVPWPPPSPATAAKHNGTAIVDEPVVDEDDGFAPTTSIAEKIRSFERSTSNSELHRPFVRHNPYEKAAILRPNEVIYSVKNEYMSEPETEYDKPKKMAQLSRRQYDGIGPTTKDGMPVVLRSEVKEPNQHEWYKRIFQTIHKQKNPDEYVTIRYKCPRGRYPYKSNGYMSEPEPNYDSDYSTVKYRTLERRRLQSTGTGTGTATGTVTATPPSAGAGNDSQDDTVYGTMPNPVKSGQGSYKVQPGRIEDYITGHSSVSEKEKKEWWDEVMDIFNGWLKDNATLPRVFIEFANEVEQFQLDQQKLSPHYTEGNLSRALLKEQGYTSDSNLVFRKRDVPQQQSPLSPVEQKQVYKSVQAGGQPPLLGFRKPAPEKPKENEFEYLPITSTLTKIRAHSKEAMSKKSQTTHAAQRELICYPITNVSRPIDTFAPFPKHVPSFIPMNQPPLPPNRKSSRIRTTSMALKMSSPDVRRPTSANSRRHEACFQTKDAVSPPPPKPTKYGTITLRKTVKRTEPLTRSKSAGAVVSLLTAAKEEKTKNGRVSRKQQTIRLSSSSPVRSASRLSTLRTSSRSPVAFGRSVSKERYFAEEKKRIEETLPSIRTDFTASTNILRDPRLKSPEQVRRAVRSFALPMERSKSAPRVLAQPKPVASSYTSTFVMRRVPSPSRKEPSVTKRGQISSYMRSSTKSPVVVRSKSQPAKLAEKSTSKPMTKTSSTVSLARTSSTFSVDSTNSKVKPIPKKPLTITRPSARTETEKAKRKPVTIKSSKSDSSVLRKIKEHSETKEKIVKAIPSQQKIVRTNNFFTNLFMRDSSPRKVDEPVRQASVYEKTKYWNTMSLPPKKSVSDLRHLTCQQYRSLSPPRYVEQYESVEHFQSDDEVSEFGDRSGRTEDLVWHYEQRSRSEPRIVRPVSDIARPESPAPVFPREFSPTREIRVPQTREMRSPSRRRIQSFRGSQRGETGKVIRASSLSSADDRAKRSLYHCDDISHSANSLEYIERHSPSCRFKNSERFIDLNRFYSTLERIGQLERATSATSLKPIRKEGQSMDFEEWRKLRFHERAERELNYLVSRLKEDQKQRDFLFRPKDVEDVKWVENRDLSLRSKDKSVEDLRENFEKKIHQEWLDESKRLELESKKDTYKPYWRGSSVVDLASSMEIKYNPESGSFGVQKVKQETSSEKPLCLSNRLISTLSRDQVSKITQQLNEIYNASEPKTKPDVTEEYVITVDKHTPANALKVRCNSSISKEELIGPVLRRKESHGKPAQSKSFDRLSQEVRKFESELTETEKRRLSQTFSREIQGKARSGSPVMLARETRGAIAAENAKSTLPDIPPPPPLPKDLIEFKKPAPDKPKRKVIEDKRKPSDGSTEKILKIETTSTATIEKPEETVSKKIQYFEERKFEEPAKTIYHAREDSSPDEDEVMRVVEENIKARAESGKFHHQELSSSVTDLRDLFGERESSRINFPLPRPPPPPDETIYHESKQDQHRSTSLTLSTSRDDSLENLEALFRSRSISPQTTGTSYLHRVHTGEVRKIKDKFESLGRPKKKKHFFAISPLRKVRSDPELSNGGSKDTFKTVVRENEVGDVSRITHKFEVRSSSGRGRSRFRKPGSPIQRMPLRKEDRLMPHIDIISKTASLKQEMIKSRSPSPARQQTGLHAGEVERIRCIFETSPDRESPLRQPTLGTSSPELRDISAHLTASWIAHKYPKPLDNDLRCPTPPKHEKSVSLPVKEIKRHERPYRSRSISPPKTKQKQAPVTSILKPRYDFFANQKFDPSIHRPKARYVPDSGDDGLKRTPPSGTKRTSAVKFKDSDEVPPPPVPPTKGVSLDSNGFSNLESPNRYFESDVNIHYKTPIRYEYKDPIPEEELAIRQAQSMQKLYQEERRRKYLQELQDMNSRRHTDNFTPSQKSPIPLNRYDDFNSDLAPKSPNSSNYPKTIARALYNFQGQTARELTFKKGDVIYIRRQIDKNWYEGEHNAMIGLLPSNYVEIITKDGVRQPPKKPSEGQARAKYNFQAQSGIELSLNKGELVTLTRRVDDNWFEGKIANRKGIFPVSYVEVLVDIGAEDKINRTPASQSIITQSSSVRPSLDTLRTNINNEFNSLTSNGQHSNGILRETRTLHKTEVLHVDTNTEPVAYRALYKYRPQNTDELELQEGDIVYVLEKCDDGWFVGTSQRSGCFGTFPGNYVERV